MDYLSGIFQSLIPALLQILEAVTVSKMIGLFASLSLYTYPILIFLNAKIKTRKLSAKNTSVNNDILRYMYVKKTLFWILMCLLYAASILMGGYESINILSSPTMVVYFGLSWGLISIETRSIYRSYKEVKSSIYVPTLKRPSFWVLTAAAIFKVWQITSSNDFGAPQQLMAILDLTSYVFMAASLFIFVFFDKKKDVVEKALNKSRRIIISIKNNVVKDDKQRRKRNRDIVKVLKLLRIHLSLIDEDARKHTVEGYIRELEVLLIVSSD